MCGLAGLVRGNAAASWDARATVKAMAASLSHRGPDDEGLWSDDDAGVCLGFRRLSVLDRSTAGHQPMMSASGRYVVTFNGEIYNFKTLRNELSSTGIGFRSGTDTEVMLAACEYWGCKEAIKRFRGMFAFALWDKRDRRLWLCRDRVGIKPLYYLMSENGLAFASEVRAFHACPLYEGKGDRAAALGFLSHLYVQGPNSMLLGVKQVPPGSMLEFSVDRNRVKEIDHPRYWDLSIIATEAQTRSYITEGAVVDEFHGLLTESIRLRMVADVPIGAFLSGGIDSSVVVAVMQELGTAPIKTFTITFDDPDFDEGPNASKIAQHLGTDHTSIAFPTRDLIAMIPTLPGLSDEPMANPSLLPTLLVSRIARRDVTVALTGDGGDELFGGYNRYLLGASLIRRTQWIPQVLRRFMARTGDAISRTPTLSAGVAFLRPGSVGRQQSPAHHLRKVTAVLRATTPMAAYESLLSVGLSLGTAPIRTREVAIDGLCDAAGMLLEEKMMLRDQLDYLPGDLLAKVDRASMWESLEARVPLLDHKIIEFSWGLPLEFKIRGGVTKWPLRQVANRYFPRGLMERPKMGFSVPIARWIRKDLRDWVGDTLTSDTVRNSGLWEPSAIHTLWRDFDRGRDDLALPLWAVTTLQAWSDAWGVTFG